MEDSDGLDPEFAGLPDEVQEGISTWVGAVRDADQKGAELLSAARKHHVRREDIIAVSRRRLNATFKRTGFSI